MGRIWKTSGPFIVFSYVHIHFFSCSSSLTFTAQRFPIPGNHTICRNQKTETRKHAFTSQTRQACTLLRHNQTIHYQNFHSLNPHRSETSLFFTLEKISKCRVLFCSPCKRRNPHRLRPH